ncbi:hypothetical protein [Caulobacter sp. 17J65-9]|uniref:hypothetical protein n=1 Tax=Caulobacter sp. 17J65-9 TaxID=2709382 RepID=UPI0013CA4D3C|nr:hypothetical protein [Caulobacter sp. 17J65-9]NEX94697.1 hypothetical protein [Caulobacter sp. 17J65-9]
MRAMVVIGVLAAAALGGCQKKEEAPAAAEPFSIFTPKKPGRYAGVGFYAPGEMWTQIAREPSAQAAADPAGATPDDDDQIIIVVDSVTGEVRQCGNLSGFCISMNPWTKATPDGKAALGAPSAPVALTKHVADLRKEEEEAAKKAGG